MAEQLVYIDRSVENIYREMGNHITRMTQLQRELDKRRRVEAETRRKEATACRRGGPSSQLKRVIQSPSGIARNPGAVFQWLSLWLLVHCPHLCEGHHGRLARSDSLVGHLSLLPAVRVPVSIYRPCSAVFSRRGFIAQCGRLRDLSSFSNKRSSSMTSAIILTESFSSRTSSATRRQSLGCGVTGNRPSVSL
jgi:hypothetical protein